MMQSKMQNQNKMTIGITGGIGSGKSTVSDYLRHLGYKIVDADLIAREVVELNGPAYAPIVEAFGKDILKEDQSIDRTRLGEIIFHDEDKRALLNQITHPVIHQEINKRVAQYLEEASLVFADIPLLYESDIPYEFDEVWVVYTNEAVRVKRIVSRDHVTDDYAKVKIGSQMSLEEKRTRADRVLDNSYSKEILYKQIELNLSELR